MSGLPIANYAAIIDAGSSGSRIYIYKYKLPFQIDSKGNFIRKDATADILHVTIAETDEHEPIIQKTSPGISSFSKNPKDVYSSIRPLLEYAAKHIPKPSLSSTPIYVMATAGLRLLPENERTEILSNIRHGLRTDSEDGFFSFQDDSQVEIITGEYEGLYAWLALNYLLHRFGDINGPNPTGGLDPHSYTSLPSPKVHPYYSNLSPVGVTKDKDITSIAALKKDAILPPLYPETVSLIELGGGSAQIAFEAPEVDENNTPLSHPPDYVFRVNLDILHCQSEAMQEVSYDELLARRREELDLAKTRKAWRYQQDVDHSASNTSGSKLFSSTQNANRSNKNETSVISSSQPLSLPLGGHSYDVYSASFLGYGINSARKRYVESLISNAIKSNKNVINDPCLLQGHTQLVSVDNYWGNDDTKYTSKNPPPNTLSNSSIPLSKQEILLVGSSDWLSCRMNLAPLLEQKSCATGAGTCPFAGMYQPPLTPLVLSRQFFAFSEYWYSTTSEIFDLPPADFSGKTLESRSLELCTGSKANADLWERLYAKNTSWRNTKERVKQYCFKAAWIDTLLYSGHKLPRDMNVPSFEHKGYDGSIRKNVNIVSPMNKVQGMEVQWPLGAILLKVTQLVKDNDRYCQLLTVGDGVEHIIRQVQNEPEKYGLVLSLGVRKMLLEQQIPMNGEAAGWDSVKIIKVMLITCIFVIFIAYCIFQSESSDYQQALLYMDGGCEKKGRKFESQSQGQSYDNYLNETDFDHDLSSATTKTPNDRSSVSHGLFHSSTTVKSPRDVA